MKNIKGRREIVSAVQEPAFSTLGLCKFCKGRDGRAKNLYESKVEARRAAESVKVAEWRFKTYRCPHRKDLWHITKDLKVDVMKKPDRSKLVGRQQVGKTVRIQCGGKKKDIWTPIKPGSEWDDD